MYVVATHDPTEDFPVGTVLGVEQAVNPEDAVAKVADKAIDDDVLLEFNTVKSKFKLMKMLLKETAEDGEPTDVVVWEVTGEYPEGNLNLESHQ